MRGLVQRVARASVDVVGEGGAIERVGEIGAPDRHVPDDGIPFDAELTLDDVGGAWHVRDGNRSIDVFDWADVRLSVLWKAYCFASASEAQAFDDHTDDLTPEQVTDIFVGDLRDRGVSFDVPDDPATDLGWKQTLVDTYPPDAA